MFRGSHKGLFHKGSTSYKSLVGLQVLISVADFLFGDGNMSKAKAIRIQNIHVNTPAFEMIDNRLSMPTDRVYLQFHIFYGSDYQVWIPRHLIICILNQNHDSKHHAAALWVS